MYIKWSQNKVKIKAIGTQKIKYRIKRVNNNVSCVVEVVSVYHLHPYHWLTTNPALETASYIYFDPINSKTTRKERKKKEMDENYKKLTEGKSLIYLTKCGGDV